MHTDLYCLMGHPVAHSLSPWIQRRFAALTGERLDYTLRDVAADDFAGTVRHFMDQGGRGCNVTLPHKFAAAALSSQLSARAALAQACNVLSFKDAQMLGDNTDGIGLVADIEQHAGVALARQRVLLVGAGGAAAGVLGPLICAHPAQVCVANRRPDKAELLVQRHQALAKAQASELCALDLRAPGLGFDVVINATSASLAGQTVALAATVLKPGALAYDMMYGAPAQPFLDWARAQGAVARDGLGMLVGQAAQAFLIWRGVPAPARQVLAELRARMLGAK